ncbi:MAG: lipid-A-disaccharide synthase [Aridibacter sp.]
MEKRKINLMIIVGEVSGDSHAAKLIAALRKLSPQTDFDFFGATGQKMRESGVETIVKADEFAIIGIPEFVRNFPMFLGVFRKLKKEAIHRKPDAVILIDFPEFNLKFAKSMKKRGLKVIYYVSPQLWAWRKYRVRGIRKYVDLLLTILPFEKDWYAKQGIHHVEYIGNPIAGDVKSAMTKKEFCEKYELDDEQPIIALLGGSRKKEVEKILPIMIGTASLMSRKDKNLQFVIALASTRKKSEVENIFDDLRKAKCKFPQKLTIIQNETYEALNAADAAAVASGTATLETAIIRTPLVVGYKTSEINYRLLKPLINTEYFGLVNLIAQKKLARELIQNDFTRENLSKELFNLLDKSTNKKMREELSEVKKSLGDGGASELAAQKILARLGL